MENARAATPADIPRIVELAHALRSELRDMRGGGLWETREARLRPNAESVGPFLARDDTYIALGTIDDAVIGYGTVDIEVLEDGSRLGVVGDLFVEDGARAVGVGEAIADALVAFCTAGGCVGVDAFALPGHRTAKNFFERSGFTARALLMHKRLPDPT
ncbi:MAG: GNAT family N-acetyltransferase [Actinomycetota bacterium]|nr:GNAT family N-acetyltransferase [Actinomycetota bacterium]